MVPSSCIATFVTANLRFLSLSCRLFRPSLLDWNPLLRDASTLTMTHLQWGYDFIRPWSKLFWRRGENRRRVQKRLSKSPWLIPDVLRNPERFYAGKLTRAGDRRAPKRQESSARAPPAGSNGGRRGGGRGGNSITWPLGAQPFHGDRAGRQVCLGWREPSNCRPVRLLSVCVPLSIRHPVCREICCA